MTSRGWAYSSLLILVSGCVSVDFTKPGPSTASREDRGRLVDGNTYGVAAWSPDSRELYYPSRGANLDRIQAFDPQAGTTRNVGEQLSGTIAPNELVVSADGATIYYVLSDRDGNTLFARPVGSGPERLIATGVESRGAIEGMAHIMTSPVANQLIFAGASEDLFVHERATGSTRFIQTGGCRQIATVSPDGREVLCASSVARAAVNRVSIPNGSVSDLALPLASDTDLRSMHWGPGGIRVLYRQFLEYFVLDALTGSVTRVLAGNASLETGVNSRIGWSRDGGTLAYWQWRCVRSTGFLSCDTQSTLNVLRLADLKATPVAIVNGSDTSAPLLAPDGRRVAFFVQGSLYVKDLP
jgi:hypothetical protein